MKCCRWIALACAAVMTVGMLIQLTPMQAQALSSSELEAQIQELEAQNEQLQSQIDELQAQSDENANEIAQIVRQKSGIDQQISLLCTQIRVTQAQIDAYAALISDRQEELDQAQKKLEELSEKNKERIRAMEEDGSLSYWSVLFKASSFADLLDRLNMIEEIAASDRRRLSELNAAAQAVEQAKQTLVAQKQNLEQTRAAQDAASAELEEKRQESNALLSQLVARGEEYQKLIEDGETRLEERLLELAQKEQAYTEALQQEWEAAHPSTEPEGGNEEGGETGGSDIPPSSGGWTMPVSYVYVSSAFNPGRLHPILGYVRPHNGIDLAAYAGNPVYATRSGMVTVADYEEDGAGNYVFINHGDGFSSVYMHMEAYIVSEGDYVSAGQVIGYVGTTGLSEGYHLHFGIAYNGTYVNPADYIDF